MGQVLLIAKIRDLRFEAQRIGASAGDNIAAGLIRGGMVNIRDHARLALMIEEIIQEASRTQRDPLMKTRLDVDCHVARQLSIFGVIDKTAITNHNTGAT